MRCTCRQAVNEALERAAVRCDEASAHCAPNAAIDRMELGRMMQANYLAEDIRSMRDDGDETATLRQQNADLSDALALANETISRMSRCMTASDIQRAREAGDIDT